MWTLRTLPKLVRDDENNQEISPPARARSPSALFGLNRVLACISVSVLMIKTIYVFLSGAVGTCLSRNSC
jgi:hypothetical protein